MEWVLDNADSNNDESFDAYSNGDSYADVNSDGNIDLDCNNNTDDRDNNTLFLIDTESNNSRIVLLAVTIMSNKFDWKYTLPNTDNIGHRKIYIDSNGNIDAANRNGKCFSNTEQLVTYTYLDSF
jgi:hypothetical protein